MARTTTPKFPDSIELPKNVIKFSEIGNKKTLDVLLNEIKEEYNKIFALKESVVKKDNEATTTDPTEIFTLLEKTATDLQIALDKLNATPEESRRNAETEELNKEIVGTEKKFTETIKLIIPTIQAFLNAVTELIENPLISNKPEEKTLSDLSNEFLANAQKLVDEKSTEAIENFKDVAKKLLKSDNDNY